MRIDLETSSFNTLLSENETEVQAALNKLDDSVSIEVSSGIIGGGTIQSGIAISFDPSVVNHNNLDSVDLANTGITYGHIDDQTQGIVGDKTFSGLITLDNGIRLNNDSGGYTELKSTDGSNSGVILNLPNTDGTSGLVLSTNGDGNLIWALGGEVDEAPEDGSIYGRKDGDWIEVKSSGLINNHTFTADSGLIYTMPYGMVDEENVFVYSNAIPLYPTDFSVSGTQLTFSSGVIDYGDSIFVKNIVPIESDAFGNDSGLIPISNGTLNVALNADKLDGADLSTDETLASDSDILIPSEKAVKAYYDNKFITTAVTKTIGTTGDYANFVLAWDWLKDKRILQGATVTIKLVSDLILNTPASYTWDSGRLAAWAGDHVDGNRITIDLDGFDITVSDGVDTVYGFFLTKSRLTITSSSAGSIISTANHGTGWGVCATDGSFIEADFTNISIGGVGASFLYGILCNDSSYVNCQGVTVTYCTSHGLYCYNDSRMNIYNVTSTNNGGNGLEVRSFSSAQGSNGVFSNNVKGIYCVQGSLTRADNAICDNNSSDGISTVDISFTFISGASASLQNNGSYGSVCLSSSTVLATAGVTVEGNTTGGWYTLNNSYTARTSAAGAQAAVTNIALATYSVGNNSFII